ncbi:hypothetical protein [Paenibacillus sp. PK3_47]|uniref:hypothetical protein n=1 Tax=Paenibacillus sp. PK3_47 TaxID=2072642 RepID=UPI00201E3F80|nr:hypothetical protein [Paenibacillus sp. PK3_47]
MQLLGITNANLVALFANDMIPGGHDAYGAVIMYIHFMETAASNAVKFPHGFISGIT